MAALLLAAVFAINFRIAINVVLVGAVALAVIQQFEGDQPLPPSSANNNAEAGAPALLNFNSH